MNKPEEHRAEKVEVESAIDSKIRETKLALNPNRLSDLFPKDKVTSSYHLAEFGQSNFRGPIMARYVYLSAKLLSLYLARGFTWLIRWGNHL